MIKKERLYDIQDEYVEVAFDIESMVSMVKLYEDHYLDKEKNEFQDTIRVIKVVSESILKKMNKLNSKLDEIMIGEG